MRKSIVVCLIFSCFFTIAGTARCMLNKEEADPFVLTVLAAGIICMAIEIKEPRD